MKPSHALLAGLLAALPLATGASAQDSYRVKPGDVVRIEVLEDANLNRDALVLPDGRISLPLAGTLPAAGRSIEEIQGDITARLGPNFAVPPTVFVTLNQLAEPAPSSGPVAANTIDVFITGAALKPGRYAIEPGTTLLQFIAEAGGFSPFAATKRIQLRRVDRAGAEQVYNFNYDAIEKGTAGGGATVIADGDVIVVPQRRLFE